jgi:hypothetical protein
VSGGTPIRPRCASALDLRQVRPNAPAAQEIDERFVVVSLIAAETGWPQALVALALQQLRGRGRLGLERRTDADVHAQPVAVLNERVSADAQLGFFAFALAR